MRESTLLKRALFIKKNSSIHGEGIFTSQIIPANKAFYHIPLCDLRQSTGKGIARISSGIFVSDEKVLNFVNHSCDSNSEIVVMQKGAVLRSKRKILTGEEITLDYCATEKRNTLLECKCGSNKCRNYFFIT